MKKKTKKSKKQRKSKSYDFSKGIRGKYAKQYAKGTNLIFLNADLAKIFPDSKSVNKALRTLIKITKKAA